MSGKMTPEELDAYVARLSHWRYLATPIIWLVISAAGLGWYGYRVVVDGDAGKVWWPSGLCFALWMVTALIWTKTLQTRMATRRSVLSLVTLMKKLEGMREGMEVAIPREKRNSLDARRN